MNSFSDQNDIQYCAKVYGKNDNGYFTLTFPYNVLFKMGKISPPTRHIVMILHEQGFSQAMRFHAKLEYLDVRL